MGNRSTSGYRKGSMALAGLFLLAGLTAGCEEARVVSPEEASLATLGQPLTPKVKPVRKLPVRPVDRNGRIPFFRPGQPPERVPICHQTGDHRQLILVAPAAVEAFLRLGDWLVAAETCNGVDDDCDGPVDEELVAPLALRQAGVCAGALQVCQGGAGWQEPDYAARADYEADEGRCDGLDNDCDGTVDETCGCRSGQLACGPGCCRPPFIYYTTEQREVGRLALDGTDAEVLYVVQAVQPYIMDGQVDWASGAVWFGDWGDATYRLDLATGEFRQTHAPLAGGQQGTLIDVAANRLFRGAYYAGVYAAALDGHPPGFQRIVSGDQIGTGTREQMALDPGRQQLYFMNVCNGDCQAPARKLWRSGYAGEELTPLYVMGPEPGSRRANHGTGILYEPTEDLLFFGEAVAGGGFRLHQTRPEPFAPTLLWELAEPGEHYTSLAFDPMHRAVLVTLFTAGQVSRLWRVPLDGSPVTLLKRWDRQAGWVHAAVERNPAELHRTWTPGPALPFGRNEVRAVRLATNEILLVGGFAVDPERTLAEAWLLDPATESWRQVASLNESRHGGSLTLLPDGRAIYVGGYRHPGQWLASAEIYDPRTDRWSYNNPPAVHGSGHSAARLAGGELLIAGGGPGSCQVTDQVSRFDFRTDRWQVAAPIPDGGRGSLGDALVALPDGTALFVPGPAFTCPEAPRNQAYLYDPQEDRWWLAGELTQGLHHVQLALLPGGRVLKVGGTDQDDQVSPLTEIWEPARRSWRRVGDLSVPRHQGTVVRLPDGQVLAAGGADWRNGDQGVLVSAERFDPMTETWSAAPPLPQARMRHATVQLADGRFVLIGGGDRAGDSWELWPAVTYYQP